MVESARGEYPYQRHSRQHEIEIFPAKPQVKLTGWERPREHK